jgi:hypothetical protein
MQALAHMRGSVRVQAAVAAGASTLPCQPRRAAAAAGCAQ